MPDTTGEIDSMIYEAIQIAEHSKKMGFNEALMELRSSFQTLEDNLKS